MRYALLAVGSLVVTLLLYASWHYRAERNELVREAKAAEVLRSQTVREWQATNRPVPDGRTVNVYPAPYNVTVVCDVFGSGLGEGGTRVPLDLTRAPLPGDVYVKRCRGLALNEPVG